MKRPMAKVAKVNLGKEIALVLLIKVAILYAIWNAFFSEPLAEHMLVPQEKMERQFISPNSASEEPRKFSARVNPDEPR